MQNTAVRKLLLCSWPSCTRRHALGHRSGSFWAGGGGVGEILIQVKPRARWKCLRQMFGTGAAASSPTFALSPALSYFYGGRAAEFINYSRTPWLRGGKGGGRGGVQPRALHGDAQHLAHTCGQNFVRDSHDGCTLPDTYFWSCLHGWCSLRRSGCLWCARSSLQSEITTFRSFPSLGILHKVKYLFLNTFYNKISYFRSFFTKGILSYRLNA